MKWLSLDTDIFDDPKVKTLLRKRGGKGYTVYNYILTQVAEDIDIDNDQNGYFETSNGENPAEAIAWDLHFDLGETQDTLDLLADLELIDPESWSSGEVFLPKLLERDQAQTYLSKQKGGRKGGKRKGKGDKKDSLKDSQKDSQKDSSRSETRDKDKDKDLDTDKHNTNNIEIQNPDETNQNNQDDRQDEPTFTEGDKEYELALKLRERIADWHDPIPNIPDPNPQDMSKWSYDMDKLLRLGPLGGDKGPTKEQVEYIIRWIYEIDDFWRDTIQSPHGIRKNLSKITAQIRRYKRNKNGGEELNGKSQSEYMKDLADELREEEDEPRTNTKSSKIPK